MSIPDVVIIAGARTPFARINGNLAGQTAVQLGTAAIRGALERAGVSPDDVDAVIMGQVLQAGAGQNPAKQSAVAAGIPWRVPATTINKVCLSGLVAITDAARMIRLGEASVIVAGGQESMGASTERFNARYGLTREEQDEIAAASHARAGRAQADGVFDDEIVPVEVPQRKGDPVVVAADEGVRPDSTAEVLGRLRPAFAEGGAITAGNSSPLSDGAAAVVVASREWAESRGLPWLALIGASGQVAGPDNSLHSQPSNAIAAALEREGAAASDLDLVEINEAFAAVSLQSMRDLDLSADVVNVHGGAIALGHPIGASGARLALHAALELSRRGGGRAAVALCGGGGQGEALLLSR